ncbi:hypothetical protein JCM16358_06880 [Halanaerocella petrolearia]
MSRQRLYSEISQYILKWTLLSILLGSLGASLVWIVKKVVSILNQLTADYYLVTPLLGGVMLGLIIYYFDWRAAGLGTNLYIAQTKGDIPLTQPVKLIIGKFLATGITLGLIGVGGLVGPLLLLGSSLVFFISQILNFFKIKVINRQLEFRVLSVCGAAATLGPMLGTPLGGGIFASEVLYKSSLDYNDLFPAILSSSFGYFCYQSFVSSQSSKLIITFPDFKVGEIGLLILAALVCGVLGQSFILIFNWIDNYFTTLEIPKLFKPLVAGGVIACLNLISGIRLQTDILELGQLLSKQLSIKVLLTFLVLKIVLTIIVISSGGSAAITDVALFSGAVTGNLLAYLFPQLPVAALVIVGLSATLASIANVPLATIVLVAEMFNLSFSLPVVIGGIIGFLVGRPKTVFKYIEELEGSS